MKNSDDIRTYAIIIIYPDGVIEKAKIGTRIFHMEYIADMIKSSHRLKRAIKRQNVYIPKDEEEIKYMLSYDIDKSLAKEGIIIIHNLSLDKEVKEEIEDWSRNYYISMPTELSEKQKSIFASICDNCDISSSWFAAYSAIEDDLVEITFDEMKASINGKAK